MTPRPVWARIALAGILVALALAGIALGAWQLERREWKHALIAAVDARVDAPPVAAPGPSRWKDVTAADAAYRHIRAIGRFLHDRETLVQAVTEAGGGHWVMTPLVTRDFTILVNRGFVPPGRRARETRLVTNPDATVTVTGLLRISEPGGGFLRDNDPAVDRWYSRDVAAIAAARGLSRTAPYFIDADATPNPGGFPTGGLTVIRFNDHHLGYALTWFALAFGATLGAWLVLRRR